MENYVTVREMYESCREDECALDNKSIAVDGWVKIIDSLETLAF